MQPDQSVHEDAQFLMGSPQRYAVLSQLCDSPARPTDLVDAVDATRTTVQRILAGFSDRQWVVKRDGEYRPTVTGRRIFEQYGTLLTELERAREFGPLAAHLGPVGDEVPPELLESGRLTVSSEQSPLAAVRRFTEWFRTVNGDVRAISPIVSEVFNEVAAELLDAEVHIEFIIDQGVLERSASDFEDALARTVEHEYIDAYVHEETLTLGLAIDTSRCCLAAYDERNNIRALVESADPAVHEWAAGVFERTRERSEPLETVI